MSKDVTNSYVHCQDRLTYPYALQEIKKTTRITGISFEGKTGVHKEQAETFFKVTLHTVENYLNQYGEELVKSMMGVTIFPCKGQFAES